MAPDVALSVLGDCSPGTVVLDPMCGSGTVVRMAADQRLRAVGRDVDPLAVLMTSVWNTEVDCALVRKSAEQAIERAARIANDTGRLRLSWIDDDADTANFIDYWYDAPQKKQLRSLLVSLRWSPPAVRDALRLAISRTIITKDRGASLARDVSHSRPHRVQDTNSFDVYAAFLRAARRIADQLERDRRRHRDR
jgi:hypothetical protein